MGYVQSRTAAVASSPVALAYTTNVTAGSLLVVCVLDDTGTPTSVSSSVDGALTLAVGPATAPGLTRGLIYYKQNAVGGATTITVTHAGAFVGMQILEYSGMDTFAALDRTTSGTGTSTTPSSGATAVTSQASEIAIGFCVNDSGGATWTAGSGYTLREANANGQMQVEERVLSATGAQTAGFTMGASQGWAALIVTLVAAVVQGGGRFLLESSPTDGYLLEDDSGVLVLEETVASGVSGTSAWSVPMVTFASVATVAVAATLARTIPMVTLLAAASVSDSATIAKTLPMPTLTSAASVTVTGTMARTVPMVTVTGAVAVPISGTHMPVIPMQQMTASGTVTLTGAIARTVPMLTFASSASVGVVTITGTIAGVVPMQGLVGATDVGITATLSRTVPMVLGLMAGTVITPIVIPPGLPPTGSTRVFLDASATRITWQSIQTTVTLGNSRTRVRHG
jgi:hypothetical protein